MLVPTAESGPILSMVTDGSQLVPEWIGCFWCEASVIVWKKMTAEALIRIASRRSLITDPITLHGLQKIWGRWSRLRDAWSAIGDQQRTNWTENRITVKVYLVAYPVAAKHQFFFALITSSESHLVIQLELFCGEAPNRCTYGAAKKILQSSN